MFYQKLINQFKNICINIFSDNLTGVYLHGSLAMNCFHPNKSDIDLIVIVEKDITNMQKMNFMKSVVELNNQAPSKGIEVSIVKKEFCKPFVYPTPFELHFSIEHLQWFESNPDEYIEKMKGTDKDLAAHFMIINYYGIVLHGKQITEVFGEIQEEYYIDSIWEDVKNAEKDIIKNPIYVVLNLCRVMAFLKNRLCLSKDKGGKWGVKNTKQEYHRLILDAVECYETGRMMHTDEEILVKFAEEMLHEMGKIINTHKEM